MFLIKADQNGDTIWTKAYGGGQADVGYAVAEASDGGYILTGKVGSLGSGTLDVFLIKTDVSGDCNCNQFSTTAIVANSNFSIGSGASNSSGGSSNGVSAVAVGTATVNTELCYSCFSLVLTPDSLSCKNSSDGTIDLTVSGGMSPYDFVWSNGGNTEDLFNISAGDYSVTVTDATGCYSRGTVVVSEPDKLVITGVVDTITPGFSDGSIGITVFGGVQPYSYLWSNGETNEDINSLGGGAFTVMVTDTKGCVASVTYSTTGLPLVKFQKLLVVVITMVFQFSRRMMGDTL